MCTRITSAKKPACERKDCVEEHAQEVARYQGESCAQWRRLCARRWTAHKGIGYVQ